MDHLQLSAREVTRQYTWDKLEPLWIDLLEGDAEKRNRDRGR